MPGHDGPTPAELELRFVAEVVRAEGDPTARRLAGTAAVFHSRTKIRSWAGEFEEEILPGAFADTLRSGTGVRLLVEHDPRSLLARTDAGNLVLREDGHGLQFDVTLPDTQLARDTYENVRAGNFRGMSFGFRPNRMRQERDPATGRLRAVSHESVDLREISITSMPAYARTSVAIRSLLIPTGGAPADNRGLRLRILHLKG